MREGKLLLRCHLPLPPLLACPDVGTAADHVAPGLHLLQQPLRALPLVLLLARPDAGAADIRQQP